MEFMCGLYKVNTCKVFKIGASSKCASWKDFFFFNVQGGGEKCSIGREQNVQAPRANACTHQ